MTAAEPTDELREAIGQQVLNTLLGSNRQPNSGDLALEVADALLAGPLAPLLAKLRDQEAQLRALTAERNELDQQLCRSLAKLRATEAIIKDHDYPAGAVYDIRRVLDPS